MPEHQINYFRMGVNCGHNDKKDGYRPQHQDSFPTTDAYRHYLDGYNTSNPRTVHALPMPEAPASRNE